MLIDGRGESAVKADLLNTRPLTPDDITPTFERHLIISDLHYRNYVYKEYNVDTGKWDSTVRQVHSPRALGVVERFMVDWKPTHLWYLGDMLDLSQLSRFDKGSEEEEGLNEDIQGLRSIYTRHRYIVPQARRFWTKGNHEARLDKFLRSDGRGLRGLSQLTYHSLFDLEREKITLFEYGVRVPILRGIFEVEHGTKVSQRSGYTAHKMLDKGVSGVSGHVHRLGTVYRTTRTATLVWAENGCLCDLEPGYVNDPDWQNGFSLVYVDRANARFHLDQVAILNGRAVWGGKVYEA